MVDSDSRCSGALAGAKASSSSSSLPSSKTTQQPQRSAAKTTFLGVYALSRPSKKHTAAQSRPAAPSVALADQPARPEDCNNTTAPRKRKRTPSDGSSGSFSSGHSFDPRSLVTSKEPSSSAPGHLRIHESLKNVAVDYAALSAYARGHHPPHASSSKLPSRSPDSSSGLTLVTAKAELVPPQPAATTATAALRKGKGRQLCMPCIEIDEKHVANPKRAASSGPTVQLLHSGEAALSEKPDGHKSSDIRRASSARPSNRISTTFQNIHERKAVFRYASDAQLVAPHPRRQQQDLKQLRIGYVPESITPSSSLDDFLASSVSGTMTSACSENPEATARPPAAHVSVAKAVTAHPQEGHDTHGDVAGEKAGAILISALASSVEKPTTSGAIYAPAANMHVLENQIAAEGDLVSTIFPENEQPADARLGRNSGQEEAPSSPPLQLQEVISISDGQQASQASAGNAKKSVSFAVGDDIESARSQQRRSTSKRARLKAIRRKQVSQEFFVGEAEDYRPSDLEDQSDDSDAISGPSKTSTTVPSSSPLTPLSSGNARPSSISSDNANLVGFLRSFSRSSGSGSGNKAGKPGGRIIARRIVDSDYSDDDGEVPLRRLKTRRPSPHKKEFQQSQPDGALVRPVRSCKSTSNSLTSATSLVEKRPTSRTLVTRSRSTGDNADCLQCHRCELYQPQSKTLRCMTCEKAVCSICLVAHYAGHPSYAATLAYLRIDPASNLPDESVDVSQIDFRCPVCKYICRCMTCLRGPIPVQKSTAPAEPFPAELASPERSESMRRTDSLLSSDADPEPLHWPSLVRGTSTRPNLKVRPRVGRTAAASSRLSKSAQHNMRLSAANNAYYDLQEAIAGEAARRAQVDAETDFVPVVSSRVPRNSLPSSPQRGLSSTSQTNSSDSNESDMVQVATSKRPRPTLSARVRLATKVGQQLGKSPAYVESRRSPRREGDQLIPYNNNEPVLTLAPEVDLQETDPHYSDQIPDPTSHEVPALLGSTEGNVPDETTANELLESLLELPDTELDPADIPPLEDLTTADIDHSSPSDTVTTASVSSFASPPANEERSVRFDLSSSYDPSTSLQAMVPSHTSIFLPGIDEDDLAFPLSSPSSTPRHQSRFLQNPISPSSTIKGLASPYFASSHPDQNHHAMHDSLYGSPSRHTAFDIDLMPEFAFDNLISA